MSNTEVFVQTHTLSSADVDMYRRLRTSGYFRLFQDVALAHCEALGVGRAKTLDRGILWVATRMRVVVARSPVYGESIRVESWPGEAKHALFPRYFTIQSDSGALLVSASGLWALMDAQTRKLVFPAQADIAVAGISVPGELPLPQSMADFTPTACRPCQTRYDDIDLNGHVNNAKYIDWFDDLFPPDFHRTHIFSELQINYCNEIPPGTALMLHSRADGDVWRMDGCIGDKKAFQIKATSITVNDQAEVKHG